jgi:hypothetical protein
MKEESNETQRLGFDKSRRGKKGSGGLQHSLQRASRTTKALEGERIARSGTLKSLVKPLVRKKDSTATYSLILGRTKPFHET